MGFNGYDTSTINDNCPHETQFTAQELDTVKHYIQNRFARTNPLRPPCKTLRVRKDIKCLSKQEIWDLVDVFKTMYANGVMDAMSLVHGSYWPYGHKFVDVGPWHRWYINQFELEMRKINPKITLPYWEFLSDFAAPEKSSVWKTFGTAGVDQNGYCVPDGAFANQRVEWPSPHCLKRQWYSNKTIPVWEGPEWVTSLIQTSKTWPQFGNLIAYTAHFKIHLSIGGYAGDMSIPFATNDPIFYIFHAYLVDYMLLKWQLSDDQNLLPVTYNQGMRYDWPTHKIVGTNIETDVLVYYYQARIKEIFQIGFGDMCYIHDQLVRPILDIVANKQLKLPEQAIHLEKSLPKNVFKRYYPKFATKTATFFDYILPQLNNNQNCDQMPVALAYNATANGRRQLNDFRTLLGIDITPDVFNAEQQYYEFMSYMNQYGYCSPYVM